MCPSNTIQANEVFLIHEAEKQFPDEWVAFEVVEVDENNYATKGRLLAHHSRRAEMWEAVRKVQPKPQHTYVAYTGPKPRKGMVSVL